MITIHNDTCGVILSILLALVILFACLWYNARLTLDGYRNICAKLEREKSLPPPSAEPPPAVPIKPTPPPVVPYEQPRVGVAWKNEFDPALWASQTYKHDMQERIAGKDCRAWTRQLLELVCVHFGANTGRMIRQPYGINFMRISAKYVPVLYYDLWQFVFHSNKAHLLFGYPEPDKFYKPPKEAPMQNVERPEPTQEPTQAPRHRTVISTLNEITLALNKMHDLYANVNVAGEIFNKVREAVNSVILNHLEQELARDAIEIQEMIDAQKLRADTAERQLLEQAAQHRAEMQTVDEVHTHRTDQATRATVAVVLETLGQRSVTLDLARVQTVWHRLDMSMRLVHGENIAVKYTIDHYKADGSHGDIL